MRPASQRSCTTKEENWKPKSNQIIKKPKNIEIYPFHPLVSHVWNIFQIIHKLKCCPFYCQFFFPILMCGFFFIQSYSDYFFLVVCAPKSNFINLIDPQRKGQKYYYKNRWNKKTKFREKNLFRFWGYVCVNDFWN